MDRKKEIPSNSFDEEMKNGVAYYGAMGRACSNDSAPSKKRNGQRKDKQNFYTERRRKIQWLY